MTTTTRAKPAATTKPKPRPKDNLDFRKDGSILVVAAGERYELPPATLGQYKRVKHLLLEATSVVSEMTGLTLEQIAKGETGDVKIDAALLMKADERAEELTIEVIREIFAGSGCPLPEDEDDWPVWLSAANTFPGRVLEHWRTVPL